MIILAKTTEGKEYLYSARSAGHVSKTSAKTILKIVNECKFMLQDGEKWFMYEVDEYSPAYNYALRQKFTIRKGLVSAWGY